MWANNEVGTLQPVEQVVEIAAEHGIPVHTDAVQAVGSVPVDFAASGVDALSFTGHKLGASVGFDALIRASVVVFGMTPPAVAMRVMLAVLVNAAIQSEASAFCLLVTGTPRFEPPRKVGMYRPLTWLGIGYAPILPSRPGFPTFGSSAYGHSHPLPMNEPTKRAAGLR